MVSGERAAFGWAEFGRVPAGGEITVIVGLLLETLARVLGTAPTLRDSIGRKRSN